MIYASILVQDCSTGYRRNVKIVAATASAVEDFSNAITESGDLVISLFKDEDFGSVCILPEDFRY